LINLPFLKKYETQKIAEKPQSQNSIRTINFCTKDKLVVLQNPVFDEKKSSSDETSTSSRPQTIQNPKTPFK